MVRYTKMAWKNSDLTKLQAEDIASEHCEKRRKYLHQFIEVAFQTRYIVCTLNIVFQNYMSQKKTATLNLRINPILKSVVQEAALKEQRSVANLIEVLIRRHCKEVGITIPEQKSLFMDENSNG